MPLAGLEALLAADVELTGAHVAVLGYDTPGFLRPYISVNFSARHHAVATFRSAFRNITGAYDGETARLAGHVEVADLILSGPERLRNHLLSPAFFDAEEYPSFSFESTTITSNDGRLAIEGNLTLRGVATAD